MSILCVHCSLAGQVGAFNWEEKTLARATNPVVTNVSIPTARANLKELILRFSGIALNKRDLVALSGI